MSQYRFVSHLVDLIHPEDYASDPNGRIVRVRIRQTDDGIEILGDAMSPGELEAIFEALEPDIIDQMLCG